VLRPGQIFRSSTVFRFSTDADLRQAVDPSATGAE